MTDRNAEFGEYVAARWSRLVRAAVLLGCSPHEAEDVTQTALTRCLVNSGLAPEVVEQTDERRYEPGTVLSVSPLPGTVVESGSTVRVTVSR